MTRYTKLIGIDLKHGYFRSGWCSDFAIAPTADTGIRLQNHRCLFKPREGGADAYVEVDGAGRPLIPFDADTALAFALALRNPAFGLYTDPVPLADGPGYQLAYPAQPAAAYLTVAARRDFNAPAGENLALQFLPRQLPSVFYLVTDRSGADSDFAIAAPDAGPGWQLAPGSDQVAVRLAQQYPGKRVLRFVSEQPVPCREAGPLGVRLLHAGTPVLGNLASPSWRSLSRVRLADTGQDVDAMVEIVKYLSNTSLTKV